MHAHTSVHLLVCPCYICFFLLLLFLPTFLYTFVLSLLLFRMLFYEEWMKINQTLCVFFRLSFTKGHFPKLAECAHFHYENVDFGTLQVKFHSQQNQFWSNYSKVGLIINGFNIAFRWIQVAKMGSKQVCMNNEQFWVKWSPPPQCVCELRHISASSFSVIVYLGLFS